MGQQISSHICSLDTDQLMAKWDKARGEKRSFPDLTLLPPEISLKILSNVDAQELRRVQPFWTELANDEQLWKRLCMVSWSYCSAYTTPRCERGPSFWKSLFSALERGTEDFNRKPSTENHCGVQTLIETGVLADDPLEIARFLLGTELLRTTHVVALLKTRYDDVLVSYTDLHDFTSLFLPIALRSFFFKLSISTRKPSFFLIRLLDIFSTRYSRCNPEFDKDTVLILTHSLNLLSNDQCNPSIKNKMSKREYIKNTLYALSGSPHDPVDVDYLGHTYDNVYLLGHIAPERLVDPL